MLTFLAITPHSPLLLHPTGMQKRDKDPLSEGFSHLAQRFSEEEITTVLSVSCHPSFERKTSSLYSSTTYELSFESFGDLITKSAIPVATSFALQLREQIPAPGMELIDTAKIDYSHAIALYRLSSCFPATYQPRFLALNLKADDLFPTEIFSRFLEDSPQRIALLLSGDLGVTSAPSLSNQWHKKNKAVIKQLESLKLLQKVEFSESEKTFQAPCFLPQAQMIIEAIKQQVVLEKSWIQETAYTDHFLGLYARL